MRPIILASIALLAVSTSASAFDKCADPMALRTLEEIRACQWRVHQAQVMEEERIALVLSIAKNSGAAKGGARVESLEVVPHVSAKDPHYAARTSICTDERLIGTCSDIAANEAPTNSVPHARFGDCPPPNVSTKD